MSALAASPASALPASFGTDGARAGQIAGDPQGIAVEQMTGEVYVSDTHNNRIDKFGPEGEFLLAWGWGVTDGETEALQTCTTTCFKGLPGPGAGEFDEEGGDEGIAVDNDPFSSSHGDVYVVDRHNSRVQKFGPNGEFILMFGREVNATTKGDLCVAGEACQAGTEGAGPGEFEGLNGRSVAVDSTGTVYVADRERVQRFSEAGVVEGSPVAVAGAGLIGNLAVDSANDIYLQGSGQRGVHKYDPTGKELGTPRDTFGYGPSEALAIGPTDELLVNDLQDNHHILSFDAEGKQLASFDRGGGEASGAPGIVYSDFTKALYVLNGGVVRIVTEPSPGPFALAGSESATEIEPTSAKLEALVNPEGSATTYHFEYLTQAQFESEGGYASPHVISTPASPPLEPVNEVQTLTVAATGGKFTLSFRGEPTVELPFNATAAEVQAALEALPGLGAGNVAVSGTEGGPWTIEFTGALAATNVPPLGADASGLELLSGGEPSATVTTPTQGVSLFDDREAAASITSLQPSTIYHFRVVAENAAKEVTQGPDQTLTTLPPVSIDGTSASHVDATSVRLEADLNPHGVAAEYRFEYDTTPYLEGQAPHGVKFPVPDGDVGSGTTDTTVSNRIQELLPSTTYHYHVIAHNTLGTVAGPDRSFTTQGAASTLPDGRAWELVSPPNKHGATLLPIDDTVIQAAAGGGGLAYAASGTINTEPKGDRSPQINQLLSTRSSEGWSTQDITTPHEEITEVNGTPSEYDVFAEDLHASVVEPEGATPLSPQTTERTPYRREASGEFVPLVTASNVPPATKFGGEEVKPGSGHWGGGPEFRTATPDLSHIVLSSPQLLAPGFKPGFEPNAHENLYELTGGNLTLLSVLPSGEPTSEAGLEAEVAHQSKKLRGTISKDGNRVVFEAVLNEIVNLYVRDVGLGKTLQLDVRQPGAAGGAGSPVFQAASSDGSKVFFTDRSQLTADATVNPAGGPDLYMCEVSVVAGHLSCALSDLTVDPHPGEAARVAGSVSAIDASGGHVYFAAAGALTSTPNARGEVAVSGNCESDVEAACNLYEYDTSAHQIKLVAVVSSNDAPDWHIDIYNLKARTSPNGRFFTFASQRSLTGYDNRDAQSGQPDEEVFLFDSASGRVSCVSCNPTGARPIGLFDTGTLGPLVDRRQGWQEHWLAASIPGWDAQNNGIALYQSRYLSDSGRMFFNAADALVPQDTNGVEDVYQYEPPGVGDCVGSSRTYSAASGGCVNLVSSGGSKEESAFLDASESGDEVFFLTTSRLTASDVDGAYDVYDAHVCSNVSPCPSPPPPPPPPCAGDACQSPSAPPSDATLGSLTYHGPGNATPAPAVKPKPKPLTRQELLARTLKACKKKHVKHKRQACERQARKRYGARTNSANRVGLGRRVK